MSTAPSALEAALAGLPVPFRKRAIDRYTAMKAAYADRQFDACGLRAGRLCEVLLRYVQNELTGSHIPFADRIVKFDTECEKLEQTPKTSGPESLRLLIPRALNLVYTLRNKRGHWP